MRSEEQEKRAMSQAIERIDELAKRAVRMAREARTPEEADSAMRCLIGFAITDHRMQGPTPNYNDCNSSNSIAAAIL